MNEEINRIVFPDSNTAKRFVDSLLLCENTMKGHCAKGHCAKGNPCSLACAWACYRDSSPIRKRSVSPEGRKGEEELLPSERFQFEGTKIHYSEIADKNAQELINEEERAKNKTEKKKAKKKRQREKQSMNVADLSDTNTINKDGNSHKSNNVCTEMENLSPNSDNKEVEELDVNAAFVSKAMKKFKVVPLLMVKEPKPKKELKNLDSIINKFIHYESIDVKEAIQYLSEAISLAPKRIDLVLKRSLLYYQLAKFEKSVFDAQKVVMSLPNSSEGYYRLGEGHFALNNLSDAESAFTKLISLNSHVAEANNRLLEIRVKQLEEMGYHQNKALPALLKSKNQTIDEAIEHLSALQLTEESYNDVYYSDDEEDESADNEDTSTDEEQESADEEEESGRGATGTASLANTTSNLNIVLTKNSPLLTDPSNVFGCSSLFVGNLKQDITYQEIEQVFAKFGDIQSIKLTTEPNCYAFVNYCESGPAGAAMEALQGSRWLLSTIQPLLIKFPHNVVNTIIPTLKTPELLLSKLNAIKQAKKSRRPVRQSYIGPVNSKPHQTGFRPHPVKKAPANYPMGKFAGPQPATQTVDCYFWRTTGCVFKDKCFNLHVPERKGIDMKSSPLKH